MTRTEEFNLMEEVKEEVKNALRRGIDNEGSAIFRILRMDQYSPRGRAIILDGGHYGKELYDCNLSGCCGEDFARTLQKARQILVLKGIELDSNKEMIKNLKKTGNIYGIRE